MLLQSLWLTGLFFIASTTPHAVPPIGLKSRYLPLGTAISLSTTTPPPTPSPSSAAAPNPTSSPSSFHLQASGDNPYFNTYFLTIGRATRGAGHGDLQVASFIPSLPPDEPALSLATFHLAANSTLINNASGGDGKSFARDRNDYWFFNAGPILETGEVFESVCEIGEGQELVCVTGQDTVFYVCVEVFETGPSAGQPVNERDLVPLLGREVDESCDGVELRVVVVPVEGGGG